MLSRTYLSILFAICHSFLCSGQFLKVPGNDGDLRAVLKQSFELDCLYQGQDGHGEFLEWFKDGIPIKDEKQGHYVVKTSETESKLIIKIFVTADSQVQRWYVTSSKSSQPGSVACEFNQIKAIPSPQGLETNRPNDRIESVHDSIRRLEDESLSLKCLIKPSVQAGDGSTSIRWEYSSDEKDFQPIGMDGVQVNGDTLAIDQVKKSHRGYYRCVLNDVPFTVLLRVKDRLAALWPFLGIVGVVLVLVVIILIFESRQKKTRRAAGQDDDENDHANNPLVAASNRGSDNENKKRAVRA